MKPNLQWQTQQLSFPKIKDWHGFAAANGIEPDFFLGSGANHVEQPSVCFALSKNNKVCAVAPLFSHSRECGLWVAPSLRRQGYGRQAFSSLLAHNTTHLYGFVSQDNPCAGAMEYLFNAFGFQYGGQVLGHRIWRFLPKYD